MCIRFVGSVLPKIAGLLIAKRLSQALLCLCLSFLTHVLQANPLNAGGRSISASSLIKSGEDLDVSESESPIDEMEETAANHTVVHKVYSPGEKKQICRKYQKKFIAYYSAIYYVQRCKRRRLSGQDIYRLTRDRKAIVEVERDAIVALKEGLQYDYREIAGKERRCRDFEGRYVTFKFGDLFYVKNCEKRVFPDWSSFESHRLKVSASNAAVLSLSWGEFSSIETGGVLPSVLRREGVAKMSSGREVVIIPISEACKGLNGKFVGYYSEIYKIDNCRKRKANGILRSKKFSRNQARIRELTSEQWLSLPDGRPMQ